MDGMERNDTGVLTKQFNYLLIGRVAEKQQ